MGSGHLPNKEAAEALARIAPNVPECLFVVAGGCAEPGRAGNLVGLGKVEDEELHALYHLTDLVVLPLRRGTGTSVKLLEALRYGKPVLTTSVGCRGYAFQSGVHGIVCDQLEAYPRVIRALLKDEETLRRMSHQASALAAQYDYRRVFIPYGDILSRAFERHALSH